MTISTVTSEALQLKLRQLLPSQQGFGTDLSASDTIIPVIDLTAAAEGSDVPSYLSQALAFGSQTVFDGTPGTTTVIANTPGFYRIYGNCSVLGAPSANTTAQLSMSDGSTNKAVWKMTVDAGTNADNSNQLIDVVVFLGTGETVSAITDTFSFFQGSVRQIADVNGVIVQPSGFTPQ